MKKNSERKLLKCFFKGEAFRNGNLGFGGQSPVIQKAGKIKYLAEDPRTLIERGEYMTNASILFGANEGEGLCSFPLADIC